MRIALVGCGAIATSHARAIASSGRARCTALLDAQPARAEALKRTFFPQAEVVAGLGDLASRADAAIVATPAGSHAALSIALLEAGLHVLCEKPLATTLDDARSMVAAAERASRVLVCGLVRRFNATTPLVGEALRHDLVGKPQRVQIWESVTDWPMPRHSFDRALSGGGAFFDVGPHVLDLLGLWLGTVEVSAYEDDAVNGVESVGRAELLCRGEYGVVPATVHLSRGFQASNRCLIVCTRGTIEIDARESAAIRLVFGPGGRTHLLEAATPPRDLFALQLEHFVDAAAGTHPSQVPSAAAVQTIALVEECYRRRRPLRSVYAEQQSVTAGPDLPYRKVLLTGANGHIGTRLVEMWAARGDVGRLRCLLRSYRNAAPVLRYPAEVVEGDLLDRESVAKAAQGCDAIVHLAVGARAAEEAETLVRVARELGIRRFVHMSSAALYGRDMPSSIERLQEETPLRVLGEPYADAKLAAERAVTHAAKDLDAVILRPHIVYGPAQRWGTLIVDRLRRDVLAVVQDGGWCNLVYVDDLVRAVDRALVTTDGLGHAFFVTDGTPRTWADFIRAHARLLGVTPPRARASDARTGRHAWVRTSLGALASIVGSDQVRALVIGTPPLHDTIVPLYRALKRVGPIGAYLARRDAAPAASAGAPDPEWTSLQLSRARLSGTSAEARLGFRPRVTFADGMERTAAWLAFFGHVDDVHSRILDATVQHASA
jgi:predicted dehydrogenase/nucleoside-diphosphate-sugar epimerase